MKKKKITLEELFNILIFYSDKKNYETISGMTNIDMDKGLKARKILKRLTKETLDLEGIKNNL